MAKFLLAVLFAPLLICLVEGLKVGDTCNSTTALSCPANAVCPATKCQCNSTYEAAGNNVKCIHLIGGSCKTASTDCPDNAVCNSSNICVCPPTHFLQLDNKACLVKVNGTCKVPADCIPNTVCSNSRTCKCAANYVSNKDGTSCNKSNAVGITASLILLMFAIVMSRVS